jgi:hypothetical protein
MKVQVTSEIRELTADEIKDVGGSSAIAGPLIATTMAICAIWIVADILINEHGTLNEGLHR